MRSTKFTGKKRTRSPSDCLDRIQVNKLRNTLRDVRNQNLKIKKTEKFKNDELLTEEKNGKQILIQNRFCTISQKSKKNSKPKEDIICTSDQNKQIDVIKVAALSKVNTLKFSLSGNLPGVCSICLEVPPFERKHFLRCGHMFHEACIDKWLETSETCPNCKKNAYRDIEQYPNLARISEILSDEPIIYGLDDLPNHSNSQLSETQRKGIEILKVMICCMFFVVLIILKVQRRNFL